MANLFDTLNRLIEQLDHSISRISSQTRDAQIGVELERSRKKIDTFLSTQFASVNSYVRSAQEILDESNYAELLNESGAAASTKGQLLSLLAEANDWLETIKKDPNGFPEHSKNKKGTLVFRTRAKKLEDLEKSPEELKIRELHEK